jgi:hypothetical protein
MKRILSLLILTILLGACAFGETPAAPTAVITPTRAPATATAVRATPTNPAIPTTSPASTPGAAGITPTPALAADVDIALARKFDGTPSYEIVRYLTSADLAGRKAGAPGADKAADYLAAQFKAAGMKPAGDNGTYFQNLSLKFIDLADAPVLQLLNADGSVARAFKHRAEFSEVIGGRAGDGQAEGKLVFLGRGTAKDLSLAGDLSDTVALIMPAPTTPRDLITQLSGRGVKGIIELTGNPGNLLVRYSYIPANMLFDNPRPVAIASRATIDELLKGTGTSAAELEDRLNKDGSGFMLTQNRVHLSVHLAPVQDAPTRNVLAILPGSDPALASQYVIVGGHYDHVGADPGGAIFQGANDNASGSAVVAGLAQYFAQNRVTTKRTIVFADWTGEEAGLVGSEYYVRHPLFPLKDTVGYVNLDVVGAGSGDGLTITNDSPSVGQVARNSATDLGIPFNGASIGGGSDHESFLQVGVPATFFIWQRYGDIHVPGDIFDKIDPLKLQKTGQVAALTIMRLANAVQ